MRPSKSLLAPITLWVTMSLGACAEGTKIELSAESIGGGGSTVGAGGKATVPGPGGATSVAKGGAVGSGGKGTLLPNGGATSTGSVVSGVGATQSSLGGGSAVGSGGSSSSEGGSSVGNGGSSATTVAAPVDGLGIKYEKQSVDSGNVRTNFVLVNQGSAAVDLTKIRLRYYFTMDGWTTPVLEAYYAGPYVGSSSIKGEFFNASGPGADRYVEISFVPSSGTAAPSLPAGSQLSIQTGLHDQTWKAPDATNDYSFVGTLVGFTDRMTVYASGSLVWGVEPGSSPIMGSGGAGGGGAAGAAGHAAAGDSSVGIPGAGSGGGGAAGATGSGGAVNAGSAGLGESAGAAGASP